MADNETIADIIAEMRKLAHELEDYGGMSIPAMLLDFSDRFEAALKRDTKELRVEIERLKEERNYSGVRERERLRAKGFAIVPKEQLERGDAAKLREALAKILGIADHVQMRFAIPELANQEISELKQIAEAALAEPPRNCDRFATLDEARKAHEAICEKYVKCHNGCPLNNEEHYSAFDCFEAWLFAPATEKEGGEK